MQLSPLEPARDPLAAQAEALGYLYLPGLLPAAPLEHLRARVIATCDALGWLAPGARFGAFDDPAWARFQGTIQADDAFRAVGATEALLAMAREPRGGQLGTIPRPAAALNLAVPSFRHQHQAPGREQSRPTKSIETRSNSSLPLASR